MEAKAKPGTVSQKVVSLPGTKTPRSPEMDNTRRS